MDGSFSLFWFCSLVLGLVEGFNGMNGRWLQAIPLPIYTEYFSVSALLIIRSLPVTEIFHDSRVATTHFPNNREV
ncbi:hypothetical protein F5888DRAFT_1184247 [Russula emetica]|nr:hypothetical protein F5888DRAFT_1184247 [Russula emetica]